VAACETPTTVLPSNAVQFAPPAIYRRWWAMTVACAGVPRAFDPVRWYRVPGRTFRSPAGAVVDGFFDSRDNTIVLSDTLRAVGAGVRHEMLHAILVVPGHPRDMFLGACADVVDCNATCAKDAGKWTAPTPWVPVASDSLQVTTVAQLQAPEADGERYLSIRVKAKNRMNQAIYIKQTLLTFGYTLAHTLADGGAGVHDQVLAGDSSAAWFAPLQTKEFLFELRVTSAFTRFTVPPGNYVFWGSFESRSSATDSITVTP